MTDDAIQFGNHWYCPHCAQEIQAGALKVVTPRATMLDIVRTVAMIHDIPMRDIMGKTRFRSVVAARHEAIKTIHSRYPNLSSVQIAKFFDMDHSSILFALGTLKRRPRTLSPSNTETTVDTDEPQIQTTPCAD